MATEEAASAVVDSVKFKFYTTQDVMDMSVKEITLPDLIDAKGVAIPNGLYDPTLGPIGDDACKTCDKRSYRCPGHCGHIKLARPVFNPLLFRDLRSILRMTCLSCKQFRLTSQEMTRYVSAMDFIASGDIVSARNIIESVGDGVDDDSDVNKRVSHSTNHKEKALTSLQHAEGKSILSKLLKDQKVGKKCPVCGNKSIKITSPSFGWLTRALKDDDIVAKTIREAELGDVEMHEDGISPKDDESSLSAKTVRELQMLPTEEFKKLFSSSSANKHLTPTEVKNTLKTLWSKEPEICNKIYDVHNKCAHTSRNSKGYEMFFLEALIVPPSKFRPSARTDRGVLEHPQNQLLSKVQESNIALRKLASSDKMNPDIIRRWMDLQRSVNVLFDSSNGFSKSDKELNGIRQMLEKKEGMLRQKMMGKRVNFACRSVISPDPYLAVNEIGIPPYFALKLTYPEKVTPWNVNKMRQAIINGSDIHPGASHFKDKDKELKLQVSLSQRNAIARKLPTSRGIIAQPRKGPEPESEGKVVYRHLQDGDIVLVNRQPTLHKPSMMAHVVRVLKGEKTLRMHYANCSTYNADFDGDEMNVHFPQDEISRAEAINIVNANKQYIVPTSGEPIRGLIQDHIVSAVILTKKDTFFTREQYYQILCASVVPHASQSSRVVKSGQKVCQLVCTDEIQPQPPAILKPKPLWTGKQIITAILCHITRGRSPFNVRKSGRIPKEYFSKKSNEKSRRKGEGSFEECTVNICNNSFIHGMIDKAQFGKYGLVHSVQELYGADIAGTLLSIFSRLFTLFLQMHGFTCGLDDLLLTEESEKCREGLLKKSEEKSEKVHIRFTSTKNNFTDPLKLHGEVEKVLRSAGESATERLDKMMSNATNELTSEVNKQLFPTGLLKPFPSNCISLMTTTGAKGGLVNLTQISSLLGQQELEGKRVPRIVSGKTLPSFPPWDISCRAGGFISDRFLTGLRPQEFYFHCMAGRDGLVDTAVKTSRSGYLQRCLVKSLESLKVCYDYTVRDGDGSIIQFFYGEDGVDVLKSSYITELDFLAANQRVVAESLSCQLQDSDLSISNSYIKALPAFLKNKATSFDPKPSDYQRSPSQQITREELLKLMELKYVSSLAEPGEPVGVVAAQSIGEPSTQMTLNTFHLAGQADMNVTLGIPRLREILMDAKENIETPLMKCPLLEGMTREDAEKLAGNLRTVCLADVIEYMEVTTVPFCINGSKVSTSYRLKIKLHRPELYPAHSGITVKDCMAKLSQFCGDPLEKAIKKYRTMLKKMTGIGISDNKKGMEEGEAEDEPGSISDNLEDNDAAGKDDGEDSDDGDNEDEGADGEKRKKQALDEVEYDEEGDEDEPALDAESDVDQAEDDDFVGGVDSGPLEKNTPKSLSKSKSASPVKPASVAKVSEKKKKKAVVKLKKAKVKTKQSATEELLYEASFTYEKDEALMLLGQIAQQAAKTMPVKMCNGIQKCAVLDNKGSYSLQTAGVNFSAFWDLDDYLDVNKIVANDIHAMLKTYGVEAARATIINEISNVFGQYGIKVNYRHLSLIGDFMCVNGSYTALNRIGMRENNTSPFTKMSFEAAAVAIVNAALHGETDLLESPSAAVCLGQPVKFGTGTFDLLQELHS